MAIEYLKLLLRVLIRLFDIVLDLLDELVIGLVGVAGVATFVGNSATASSFGLLLLLFLGPRFLGVVAAGAVY